MRSTAATSSCRDLPGAGKTTTGSHVILRLLREGKRVGVTSNSHKAINNLLKAVEERAVEAGVRIAGLKKSTRNDPDSMVNGKMIVDVTDAKDVIGAAQPLVGGTAWVFAEPDLEQTFDYLFVDEAGQVSLANLVAMSTAAKNIVLIGDQMQLGQPIQGVHPGRSGESTLEYLLDGLPTVPADRGIFLATSWRMHPDVCRFISDAVYDGRLAAAPGNDRQELILGTSAHCGVAARRHPLSRRPARRMLAAERARGARGGGALREPLAAALPGQAGPAEGHHGR